MSSSEYSEGDSLRYVHSRERPGRVCELRFGKGLTGGAALVRLAVGRGHTPLASLDPLFNRSSKVFAKEHSQEVMRSLDTFINLPLNTPLQGIYSRSDESLSTEDNGEDIMYQLSVFWPYPKGPDASLRKGPSLANLS
ncbi:hypothetical protein HPB51_025352 [Rhipicephalus microplus]|uniref:Uncharacterized protein n=1 Tax=Rhipicephalus microplus TaxID=6941 RepID=A0A9J6EK85_RHIMP|nr:hypothetical protein HPB51_025352 [Rhipicephalus microplus]